MLHTVHHQDGTRYQVERIGSGRWFDTYAVHCEHGYFRVYANNTDQAISKARAEYAKRLTA